MPADDHFTGPDMVRRQRVVPLRSTGSRYRPTPLGEITLCVGGSLFYVPDMMFGLDFNFALFLFVIVLATPIIERADILRNRHKRKLIRAYRSARKKGLFFTILLFIFPFAWLFHMWNFVIVIYCAVRRMEPPLPKDFILLLKSMFVCDLQFLDC